MDDQRSDGTPTAEEADRRRFDPVSAAMALVTTLLLMWAAWLRFGPALATQAPTIGALAPALRLIDPETSEPLVLLGLKGKVVWISFIPGRSAPVDSDLMTLESVWKRFKTRPRFAMAVLRTESDRPSAAVAGSGSTLPTYIAMPETCRAFGARAGHLPLHVLLDPSGRVAAVAQSRSAATLSRLADQAERGLNEIEPLGKSRFAQSVPNLKDRGRAGTPIDPRREADPAEREFETLPMNALAKTGHRS